MSEAKFAWNDGLCNFEREEMQWIRDYLPWLLSAVTIYMTVLAGNKHHFSTDGTEQDPNGAHAWLERNDKPNTTAEQLARAGETR